MNDPHTRPEPRASALIVIDVQNDFTLPGAPACIPGTVEAVPAMRRTLEAFRAAARPIFHIVRLYTPDGSNADLCRRRRLEDGDGLVLPGSPGAELVEALKPEGAPALDAGRLLGGSPQALGAGEWALYKPRWSAFHATGLEPSLRELGVTTIVLIGCNFPNCPRATLYDASGRDFRLVIVPDALSGLYDKGLQELAAIGTTILPAEGVAAWLGEAA